MLTVKVCKTSRRLLLLVPERGATMVWGEEGGDWSNIHVPVYLLQEKEPPVPLNRRLVGSYSLSSRSENGIISFPSRKSSPWQPCPYPVQYTTCATLLLCGRSWCFAPVIDYVLCHILSVKY